MRVLYVMMALPALFSVGCAAMADSSASFASVSSISASFAGSSAGTLAANPQYHDDVRTATAAAVEAGASEREVLRHVGQVAVQHGVTDWEAESSTYVSIGQGLKLGGVESEDAQSVAPKLAGGDSSAQELLLAGYKS